MYDKQYLIEKYINGDLHSLDLIDIILDLEKENKLLKNMVEEGLTFEDIYNSDDEISPHCR